MMVPETARYKENLLIYFFLFSDVTCVSLCVFVHVRACIVVCGYTCVFRGVRVDEHDCGSQMLMLAVFLSHSAAYFLR